MRLLRKLCCIALLLSFVSPLTMRAERRTPDIVVRASRCVDTFIQSFSNVVAEERYVQESAYPHRRRELLSDFLLVTPPGTAGRYQFRDVREVGGAAVRRHVHPELLECRRRGAVRAGERVSASPSTFEKLWMN